MIAIDDVFDIITVNKYLSIQKSYGIYLNLLGASFINDILHVGCGHKRKTHTTRGFNTDVWEEIRLDIDPSVSPDVTGTMTDMAAVAAGSVQAIFSSHNIEHLYLHEVPVAFGEFLRVLSQDGFVVITCPDLKSVCALVAEDKLLETAYTSPAGPIMPLDIIYGHRPAMERGNLYMAHRCGFTQKVLSGTLKSCGFKSVATMSRGEAPYFDLFALASKSVRTEAEMRELVASHFPIQTKHYK
jgi:predicted SAM-dependent methyltransferase